MADNTSAFFLYPPQPELGGAGLVPSPFMLEPEAGPAILWGQGTPDGDRAPFTLVNKGSLYLEVDGTDNRNAVWIKLDEASVNADWGRVGDPGLVIVTSALFDISAADSEQVVFRAVGAAEVVEAGLVWNEATAASGAAEGDITIGTATGGAQIVAATAYGVSLATGAYTALTIANGALAAGTSVFASHDVATGAAGTYYLQLKIRLDIID